MLTWVPLYGSKNDEARELFHYGTPGAGSLQTPSLEHFPEHLHHNPYWSVISLLTRVCPYSATRVKQDKMGVWDVFTGTKKSATAPTASDSLHDTAPTTTYQTQRVDLNAEDVGSFMTTSAAFDPASLHPLAGLNQDTLDYLQLDDSALLDPGSRSLLPSRGWSDDLCYGTGVTYLTALSIGGAWGLAEGLNRLPSSAPPKLRLNSALNAITRRGPFLGNSAGVVAMMYSGINSTIGYARGKHDSFNSIAAGGISGMLFKSTRGVRPMMISGGIVASVAGTWAVSHAIPTRTLERCTDSKARLLASSSSIHKALDPFFLFVHVLFELLLEFGREEAQIQHSEGVQIHLRVVDVPKSHSPLVYDTIEKAVALQRAFS
nr:mitochondrial import inner membrane translocase subunit tim23 [Quercus suber]